MLWGAKPLLLLLRIALQVCQNLSNKGYYTLVVLYLLIAFSSVETAEKQHGTRQ